MADVPIDITMHPNPLAGHYRRFRVHERCLLTGHSHQAWPDVAFEGHMEAWLDAAEFVDEKWKRAEEKAWEVRKGYARLLGDRPEQIALGASTHDLLIRFLSGLPLRRRPRLVTTDGEFHTIRRQLSRLEEEGIEVVRVPSVPPDGVTDALIREVNEQTAAVLVSRVMFLTAHQIPGLDRVYEHCQKTGSELLVDVYHALNVIPFDVKKEGLDGAWVIGGGYKYCQLGEGNAFLRFPPGTTMRPVITGWFAEFARMKEPAGDEKVVYPEGPERFAGATYDPTSHYRAAAVFRFFLEYRLTPEGLHAINRQQIRHLMDRFDALDVPESLITRDRDIPIERLGGFLSLRTPHAERIHKELRRRGVLTDFRGPYLRLGPAPYLSLHQLDRAMDALEEVLQGLGN